MITESVCWGGRTATNSGAHMYISPHKSRATDTRAIIINPITLSTQHPPRGAAQFSGYLPTPFIPSRLSSWAKTTPLSTTFLLLLLLLICNGDWCHVLRTWGFPPHQCLLSALHCTSFSTFHLSFLQLQGNMHIYIYSKLACPCCESVYVAWLLINLHAKTGQKEEGDTEKNFVKNFVWNDHGRAWDQARCSGSHCGWCPDLHSRFQGRRTLPL